MSQNVIINSVQKVYEILPKEFRLKGLGVILFLNLNAVFDLLGLAAILPLLSVILQENAVENSYYLKNVYDYFEFTSENSFIFFICGFVILLILVKNIFSLFIQYYNCRFSFALYRRICTDLQKYYYGKGYIFLKKTNSTEIVRNINTVPMIFVSQMVLQLFILISEVVVLLIIFTSILLFDVKLLLLLLVLIAPTFFIFYSSVKNTIQKYEGKKHDLNLELNKSLYQSIFGYVDSQINNKTGYFFNEYSQFTKKMASVQTMIFTFKSSTNKVIETTMIIGLVAILLYGLNYLDSKAEIIALLGAFGLAAYRVMPSINKILFALMSMKGVQYTLDIVKNKPEQPYEEAEIGALDFEKEILFDNVSFNYEGSSELILDSFNLEISKGEFIGLIGKSGAGKSTLAQLLLRFLIESKGSILIDGIPLSEENIIAWRNKIGYVQQDVYILDGTIAENVAFGFSKESIDRALVNKVIERSSLTSIVEKLENGLDTRIGERGSQLSGGQRQRIGIARALYTGAEILVFDEATSALDNETEKEITETIRVLREENSLTLIVIAHRISTLKYCDRIVELEKGAIKNIYKYEDIETV